MHYAIVLLYKIQKKASKDRSGNAYVACNRSSKPKSQEGAIISISFDPLPVGTIQGMLRNPRFLLHFLRSLCLSAVLWNAKKVEPWMD